MRQLYRYLNATPPVFNLPISPSLHSPIFLNCTIAIDMILGDLFGDRS
ncbi:MAG: hypothetical protein O4965_09905 [Trichodesmium sp. St19_bin1]|nr:hypothetical protein [Trichodesmium sp. St19_bin1]